MWTPLGDKGAADDLFTSGNYAAVKYTTENTSSAVTASVDIFNISVTTGPLVMDFDVNVP